MACLEEEGDRSENATVVRVWELPSGRELGKLRTGEKLFEIVAFASDHRAVAFGTVDHVLHVTAAAPWAR